jgi:hypothetical protein
LGWEFGGEVVRRRRRKRKEKEKIWEEGKGKGKAWEKVAVVERLLFVSN